MLLTAGSRLGPYEITGALGAGGMGEVYRARDTRLERQVAIKLLTTGNPGEAADRLLQEARSASALNHPHICTLHEIGDAAGQPFIVMELVEGESLERRIAGQGLPVATVLRLGAQIADALGHAHARGVVHRDLKSANVAVTAEGRAKILDFGIARRIPTGELAEATRSVATLAGNGEIAGTLPYMAPEVLQGRHADARSDLWALGVMLVEMTSGSRPFKGDTGFALSTAILRDPPDIPGVVPSGLAAVIRRLLAKDPAERYQSAAEAAAAIEILSTGEVAPVAAPHASGKRRPAAYAAAALLVLAALAGVWWNGARGAAGSAAGGGSASIASIAVLPLDNLSSDAGQQYFADGMTEALISDLSAIDDLRVISRTSVMQFQETTRSLRDIAEALRVDGIVEGAVLRTAENVRITARLIDARSERQLWRGVYEKPLSDAITLQREIAGTIGREIRGELSPADQARLTRQTNVDPQAFQAYLRGRFQWNLRSAEALKQAATLFQEAITRDPGFALAHAGLADVYVVLGDYRDLRPAEAYGRAREAVDLALRLDPTLAEAHTTRAWLAFALERDWRAAEEGFQRAFEANAGYATAHQWHGEFLAALGQFDEAFKSMRRARELDPLARMPQAIHGWLAHLAGRQQEAIDLCEGVLAHDPTFRPARMYRAWSYMDQNRLDEAEAEIHTLLSSTTSRAVPVATLGRIHARRGEREKAHRAIAELRSLPYPPSFDIAKLHAELRERDQAIEWLRRSEAERSSAVLYVNVDRVFAWLKGDPGFEALLVTLNLAPKKD
ncbi:MAG TPA: protein kinase [Vicinamibacterales bacterium]|nr:protein kinase [Vicinamibacterales bacterium]